ncbi:hypothetical protein BDQ17DRAFT_1409499 [Cyathus striatus]|nr:hypothetical protein BDQ17DRAFT_1409499 [Cyathus striatus]
MPFRKRTDPSTSRTDVQDEDYDPAIDPELRLRTVRTAASAIAESIISEQRTQRRKTMRKRSRFFRRKEEKKTDVSVGKVEVHDVADVQQQGQVATGVGGEKNQRRNVYVNQPLSAMEVDQDGEPLARYVRNKVRTTKYTILTFIPKNLYEQFRRVANLFFLSLVIVQLFPVFGAAAGSIAVLPLAFILLVTAIKDGIEDYRRSALDEEVNTSAATKLGGGWRNVNQPIDPRSWIERVLGLNPPGKVTRGVRKLREREAGEARVVLERPGGVGVVPMSESSLELEMGRGGAGGRKLDDIQSIDEHERSLSLTRSQYSYPPSVASAVATSSSTTLPSKPDQPPHAGSTGVIDFRKHTSGSSTWERTLWKKLEVGDIVLLRDNDQVPADIVVLATSDPEGVCYLETKNLDGETNLKPRKALKATSALGSEEDVERCSFVLDSEPPSQNLYLYRGVLRYRDPATGEARQEPVGINELLLRGCSLRNTSWVIGLVVFTGADTKIMLNGGETPSKRSKIEKETNFNVVVNFVLLSIMCLVTAIVSGVIEANGGDSQSFFEQGADASTSVVLNAIITFVSCLIAFQNIVPISLYISIEIVKTIQAYFISQDIEMYYEPYDTPCVPKTWNISDDLGQIEYIFSDKTGTLTQNVMEFQRCSVGGVAYGEGVTEAQRGAAVREGKDGEDKEEMKERLDGLKDRMVAVMNRGWKNRYLQKDKLTLISPRIAEDLTDRNNAQRGRIIAFFRALAVCHTVLADKPDPQAEPYHVNYKAESPDEAALVAAARDVGFPFVGKSKDNIDIEVLGQSERHIVLRVLEFNSTRKRMSVVVRTPEGKLVLYCKGADSVIYERLSPKHDPELKDKTSKDMEMFANSGLRTLCIAHRELAEDEYFSWSRTYDAAASSVENREEEVEKASELIERDLIILGATALEDKLQEGVPEAIEMLHRAGIKLWILTGDKLQTAIEIGYSCNLLKNDMEVMILSADSFEQARSQIEAGLNKIASVLGPPTWNKNKNSSRGFMPGLQKASFAVVIDGDTLRHALTPELKQMFLNLGTQCETVVCCRVSPAQKALTVNLVKEGRNAMTLSIGDGANDVAMIQEANIGCGLFGLEGSQAAMSADYAFGQFRFLTKLLLVHGRWSYQRVADMHANFFYKNVIWTFAMFWFLPFNSFDATYLYQYTFILLYNLVFTSLPVIILGAFDQDINAQAALAFPQLYVRGIRGLEYTRMKFWMYMCDGLYQSVIVFFLPYLVWTMGPATSWNGKGIESLADFGTTVSVAAIVAANTYVGINTNYWTVITWIIVIGSSVVMLIWIAIYSFFFSSDFIDEVIILFGTMTFWATVAIATIIALDIVREMWVKGDLKDQLGVGHRRDKGKGRENLRRRPEQHSRSVSEISAIHHSSSRMHQSHSYEPAYTGSPGPATPRQTYLDTPPMSEARDLPLDGNSVAGRSDDRLSPLPPGAGVRTSAVSPQPSYYSASDIPAPSPLPEPTYRYPTGEITTTPPSRKGTVKQSGALSPPASPGRSRSPGDMLHIPSPHTPTFAQRLSGGGGNDPGSYEMRVRSPPHGFERAGSEISQATFMTAPQGAEEYDVGEDGFDDAYGGVAMPPQPQFQSQPQQPPSQQQFLHPQSLAPDGERHDRRTSYTGWEGGRAV